MAASIACLLATFAGLAMLCPFHAVSANAWDDDSGAVSNTLADLTQWNSVLVVPRGPCMKQGWRSTLSAIAPQDFPRFHVASGGAAFGKTMDSECDPAPDSGDAKAVTRRPAHDATGKPVRSNPLSR